MTLQNEKSELNETAKCKKISYIFQAITQRNELLQGS